MGEVVNAQSVVSDTFRAEWGRIVAHVIRVTGDWDLAEECAQDAFAKALERWPRDGIPSSPAGWLKTTARNRAIDRLRRSAIGTVKHREEAVASLTNESNDGDGGKSMDESGIADDRLRLIFTCCHPALALDAQVALTLRTLAGLTTTEIAKAFLVPSETMAKRLVRAKHKIRDAKIPYRVPVGHMLPGRTSAVLAVLYGTFNEGYSASSGAELLRTDLCNEAIRLGRLLAELMPDEPETLGLLALMILHNARRDARTDAAGDVITLEEQNRTLWNATAIDEAGRILDAALRLGRPGPYQVMAAIAACHATASSPEATDWFEIAALYERLAQMISSPVIALNQAVAVGMATGPSAGLILVEQIEENGDLSDYYLLAATRADLLRRLGHREQAVEAYRRALELAPTGAERRFLAKRIAQISIPDGPFS